MAHDVFISYSSKDKPTADATCAVLEQHNIRCWMAPRDIMPGADWSESIVDALQISRAMVLVFSTNANLSQQIKREVERAVNKGIPVIPLRIENVMPEKSLEYFLSTPHWLDAFNPPLEQHLNYLAQVIQHILDGKTVPEPPKPVPAPAAKLDRRTLMIGAAAVVVALIGWMIFGPSKPPSFIGKWTMTSSSADADTPSPFGAFSISAFAKAVLAGGKLTGSMDINELGNYKYVWGGEDHGTVAPKGGSGLTFTSDITHGSQDFNYLLSTAATFGAYAPQLGGNSSDGSIALQYPGSSQSILVGNPSGASGPLARVAGHWHADTNTVIGAVKTALDITPDGHYTYTFSIAETGMFDAKDGKWTRTPQGGAPIGGTYKFDGRNKVAVATSQGSSDWKRD